MTLPMLGVGKLMSFTLNIEPSNSQSISYMNNGAYSHVVKPTTLGVAKLPEEGGGVLTECHQFLVKHGRHLSVY